MPETFILLQMLSSGAERKVCQTTSPSRLRRRRQQRGWLRGIELVALCLLAACRTAPTLTVVNLAEPGWGTRQGQAIWRSHTMAPEIAGELFVATHPDGRTFLQFTKTPLPFIVVQTTTNSWAIEFVAENKTYSGRGQPPARLAWLELPRCLAGADPLAPWKWETLDAGRWRLESAATGEMLEGYLTR
jgi:hypothetical protein